MALMFGKLKNVRLPLLPNKNTVTHIANESRGEGICLPPENPTILKPHHDNVQIQTTVRK